MELISLLNQRDWGNPEGISKMQIEEAMSLKVSSNIKRLYQSYYRGILLNSFFFLFFMTVYLFNQSLEFLIPVLMIISVFAFIIVNVAVNLLTGEKVDPSGDLKSVLVKMLALDKRIYSRQCRYNQLILMTSFVSGFLLGLAYQGWTLAKYYEKPAIFLILVILASGFYYLTKTQSFNKLNRFLNPTHHQAKSFLQQQLDLIRADDE